MIKRRGSEFIAVIGMNNTGKTVIAKEFVKEFNKKRDFLESKKKYPKNYNKLIVYDPQDRFKDVMREGDYSIQLSDNDWQEKILNYRASMIILDDYKELFRSDTLDERFLAILSNRARFGLDIMIITWHPKLILPRLTMFINKYILLKVNSDEKTYCERIDGDKDRILNIKKTIDKEFSKYTDEEYSKKYPNFPFIFWDSVKNVAKKVNF